MAVRLILSDHRASLGNMLIQITACAYLAILSDTIEVIVRTRLIMIDRFIFVYIDLPATTDSEQLITNSWCGAFLTGRGAAVLGMSTACDVVDVFLSLTQQEHEL